MSNEPSDFSRFLDRNDIADPQGLISFLNDFNADPGVFYSLSDEDRETLDGRMDQTLDAIISSLGGQEINQ